MPYAKIIRKYEKIQKVRKLLYSLDNKNFYLKT